MAVDLDRLTTDPRLAPTLLLADVLGHPGVESYDESFEAKTNDAGEAVVLVGVRIRGVDETRYFWRRIA